MAIFSGGGGPLSLCFPMLIFVLTVSEKKTSNETCWTSTDRKWPVNDQPLSDNWLAVTLYKWIHFVYSRLLKCVY